MPISPLVIASHNAGKLAEWRALLGSIAFFSAAERGVTLPEETGTTYLENAAIKAIAAARATGCVAIGDDTGLEVPSLDGEPGVHTATWVAACGGWTAAYESLAARTGVRDGVVPARLVCAIVVVDDGHRDDAEVAIDGRLCWPPGSAPGPAAIFTPDVGPVLEGGVLIHRRAAFDRIAARLRQRLATSAGR